jgi:SNF2 family DNA or RNA helicase
MSDTILHGTWVNNAAEKQGWFLFWGEGKFTEDIPKPRGRMPKIGSHPYAADTEELKEVIHQLYGSAMMDEYTLNLSKGEAVLSLPILSRIPLPARQTVIELKGKTGIWDFKVDAIYLKTDQAIALLSAIPLRDYDLPCRLGADMRFWNLAAKFVLHLISQHKFIPMLSKEESGGFFAFWEPVLDDLSDMDKLKELANAMPDSCRCVKSVSIDISSSPTIKKGKKTSGNKKKTAKREISLSELPEMRPGQLMTDFLKSGIDSWVRSQAADNLISEIPKSLKDKSIIRWLKALAEDSGQFQSPELESGLEYLCESIAEWRNAGITASAKPEKFRVCFRLESPKDGEQDWLLRYFLQAMDDLSLLVPADAVWRERRATLRYLNREFESPQERLLVGLGIAARIFPPIERSLRYATPESCVLNTDEAYQFLSESSVLIQQSGFGVLAPTWWTDKRSYIRAKVSISPPKTVSSGILSLDTLIQYDWQLALGDDKITPEELEHLAKLKIPLVQMRGEWVILRPEDIQAAMEFFKKGEQSGEMSLREAVKLSLNESPQLEGVEIDSVECPEWFKSFVDNLKGGKLKRLRQPEEFTGKLRPYQLRGMSWLAFMRQWGLGACLADDMGLGKTIQVIAFMLREKKLQKDNSRPNLLICPTSVVGNWKREMERFAPILDVVIHHGSDRLSGEEFANSAMEYDLVITSYGLARRDAEDLVAVNWKGLILDEAQNIKNPSAKTAKVVRSLNSEYRFALTGTPVENRLMELWSIMEFLNPKYLGSQKNFQERFALPIERYGNEDATKELRSVAAPFILRRLKTDPKIISDLPEKLEMKIYCNLTREQVTLYEAVVKDMMQQLDNNGGQDRPGGIQRRGMVLAGLTKLKQLCNHPALFLHDHSPLEGRSGKLQRLVEMLEEAISEDDKVLIFTQFTQMGEALQGYLESKFRCDTLFLHGGVPQKKRDRMVSLFQESSNGPPFFIISIRAGGTGLNLTRANHVFHFDRWWNPAVEDQATDRTFRIGQTRTVQVHKFICAGTFEERIDELIDKKKSLAESIIGSGEDWLTELSNDELREMVTLRQNEALSADER